MPMTIQHITMFQLYNPHRNSLASFSLEVPPTGCSLCDALPWLSTHGIVHRIYLIKICHLTIFTVIQAITTCSNLFLGYTIGHIIWMCPIQNIHSHMIVSTLIEFYSIVFSDVIVKVSHDSLHCSCTDISTMTGSMPSISISPSIGIVTQSNNIQYLIHNIRISPCHQESSLVGGWKFSRNNLWPIPCNESFNGIRESLSRSFQFQ
mmetsp:Transcript_6757/g.12723  ORF Transcript_6757/g.12723 Transcript_6757/m.12723 type:complete len:206 (+) Transcript_6757:2808-3425(+)